MTMPNEQDPAARGSGHEPSDAVQRLREAIGRERLTVPGHGVLAACCDTDAALVAVEREMAHMDAQGRAMADDLMSWENREAACCPEDVGFEEHIAALEAERDELRKERDARPTLEEFRLMYAEIKQRHLGNQPYGDTVLFATANLYAEKAKATEAQHG